MIQLRKIQQEKKVWMKNLGVFDAKLRIRLFFRFQTKKICLQIVR